MDAAAAAADSAEGGPCKDRGSGTADEPWSGRVADIARSATGAAVPLGAPPSPSAPCMGLRGLSGTAFSATRTAAWPSGDEVFAASSSGRPDFVFSLLGGPALLAWEASPAPALSPVPVGCGIVATEEGLLGTAAVSGFGRCFEAGPMAAIASVVRGTPRLSVALAARLILPDWLAPEAPSVGERSRSAVTESQTSSNPPCRCPDGVGADRTPAGGAGAVATRCKLTADPHAAFSGLH